MAAPVDKDVPADVSSRSLWPRTENTRRSIEASRRVLERAEATVRRARAAVSRADALLKRIHDLTRRFALSPTHPSPGCPDDSRDRPMVVARVRRSRR